MRVSKRDGKDERRILVGMIVDPMILGRVVSKWEGDLFNSRWSNLVGSWCVKFFQRYEKAPGKSIEGLFESWAGDGRRDKETVELVEKFLARLSGDYEELAGESNSEYIIDLAGTHFNRVKLQRLAKALQGDVDGGDVSSGLKRVADYGQVEMGAGAGVDVFQDQDAIREAFKDKTEPLIKYPGALGKFFGDVFERDAFVAFMGSEKRGKSWWLMDVAYRGLLQRRKVAFFEVGDMSQNQIMRRLMIRASGRPLFPRTISYPMKIHHEVGDATAEVDLEEREFKKRLSWQVAYKSCQKIMKRKVKSKHSLFRLSCHPNSTISVAGIRSILQNWERSGWTPDVVVIDYADILAPPAGSMDTRDQINATWKQLRAMSQSLHCLVVTATQADAQSYTSDTIRRSNFSEDKRKLGHVTGLIGISATDEEKSFGMMRLNFVVLREEEFSESKCVYVAGCLPIGNPAIRSTW